MKMAVTISSMLSFALCCTAWTASGIEALPREPTSAAQAHEYERIRAKVRLEDAKAKVEAIERLSRDDLILAVPRIMGDNVCASVLPVLCRTRSHLAKLLALSMDSEQTRETREVLQQVNAAIDAILEDIKTRLQSAYEDANTRWKAIETGRHVRENLSQ